MAKPTQAQRIASLESGLEALLASQQQLLAALQPQQPQQQPPPNPVESVAPPANPTPSSSQSGNPYPHVPPVGRDVPQTHDIAGLASIDNSKRKVTVTTTDSKGEEQSRQATQYLGSRTREIITPLLKQQAPSITLRVCINGQETNHYINLSLGETASGSLVYSADRKAATIPIPVSDQTGQALVSVSPFASLMLAAQEVMRVGH